MLALATTLPHPLAHAVRRRGILAILITNFFAWAGFFLIVPLIAVHYVDNLGWTAGTVGLLLGIRQIMQQSMTTLFGVLADRVGPRPLIATGMLIRGAGFAAMAWSASFVPVLFALLLSGLGGALFESPRAAAFAYLSHPEERQRLYALSGVISSLGVTFGTQLGALLIQQDFAVVCYAAAAAYVIMFGVTIAMLPPMRVSTAGGGSGALLGLGRAFHDRTFMLFLVLLTGYWFAWTQFALTLTLAATDITGTSAAVAWIYAVNTGVTVAFGYALPRVLERWFRPIDVLAGGTLVLAMSLGLVAIATSTPIILLAAGMFALGVAVARPGLETVTANLAEPTARGTYFGVAALSLAFGGGLGNLFGGVLYDLGERQGMGAAVWLAFAAIAATSAIGLWANRSRFSVVRDHGAQPSPADTPSVRAPATASAVTLPLARKRS